MPAPPPDARTYRATLVDSTPCGNDGVLLTVRPEKQLEPIRASRFFMLKRADGVSPLIPRPFSIYRQSGDTIEFLLKVMGRGTRALAEARPGQELILTGPLGNGWPTLDGDGDPWVLLAGGVGSAPFYMAIQQALAGMDGATPVPKEKITYLFGAANAGFLYDIEAFRSLGIPVYTATDDGSEGHRGNVLTLLHELWEKGTLPERVRLLACGPDPMLEAVEDLSLERGLDAWLSLETLMGCGVGICNGCPVDTRPDGPLGEWPNAKCCVEGPVFHTGSITLHGPGNPHGSPSNHPTPRPEPEHVPARGKSGN